MSAVKPASLQDMSLAELLTLFEDVVARLRDYEGVIWGDDPRRDALEEQRRAIYAEAKRRDER